MNQVDQAIKAAAKNRIDVASRYGSADEETLLRSLATYMEGWGKLPAELLFWDKNGAIYATMIGGRTPTDAEDMRMSDYFEAWANEYGRVLQKQLGGRYTASMHWSSRPTYPFSNDPEDA